MNARSIRFRLVGWYAGMFVVICTAFGAYTFLSLRHYLSSALQDTLRRRAHQIGTSILLSAERTGESFVIDQIKTLYGPELNDRFIRISRPDGSLLYVSGAPYDMSFEPTRIPKVAVENGEAKVTPIASEHMLLLSAPFAVRGSSYLVEVGASTLEGENVLRGFVLTLGLSLPVVLAFAVGGGFMMVQGALRPVHRVTDAAREITLHNLSRRLPVVRTGDEIERLTAALNQMIARLDEAFQHAGRFTADASHELRTPLTVMRGELESVVQDASLGPRTRERIGSVLEETERLARIVEDLLAISRLEAGEARLERSRFDLSNLVVTTADQMSLLAVDKGIEVACVGDECVEIEGDPARLKQVIVNLLDNAVKYSPPGGRVSLETRRFDRQAVLEVADTGPGVPAAALPRIFDRFFRVDGTRGGQGGAGLGLSIVRLICVAHGGTVVMSNQASGGCQVTVTLPLASGAGEADAGGGGRL